METKLILDELQKITDRLDIIDTKLDKMSIAMSEVEMDVRSIIKNQIAGLPISKNDKYKSWPTEDDLDKEEAAELEAARKNASEEWKTLNIIETRNAFMLEDEKQHQKYGLSQKELDNGNIKVL